VLSLESLKVSIPGPELRSRLTLMAPLWAASPWSVVLQALTVAVEADPEPTLYPGRFVHLAQRSALWRGEVGNDASGERYPAVRRVLRDLRLTTGAVYLALDRERTCAP
jgi:hypothetical protein